MKIFRAKLLYGSVTLAAYILLITPAFAKEKASPENTVDSGSFGVFNGEHRVATETFSIAQGPDGSVVTVKVDSSFKVTSTISGFGAGPRGSQSTSGA